MNLSTPLEINRPEAAVAVPAGERISNGVNPASIRA